MLRLPGHRQRRARRPGLPGRGAGRRRHHAPRRDRFRICGLSGGQAVRERRATCAGQAVRGSGAAGPARFDLAVIGAGPAGLTAAVAAADAGCPRCVLDLGERPGGQYWRWGPATGDGRFHHGWPAFTALRARFTRAPGRRADRVPARPRRVPGRAAARRRRARSGCTPWPTTAAATTPPSTAAGRGRGHRRLRPAAAGPRLDAARRHGRRRGPGTAQGQRGGGRPPGRRRGRRAVPAARSRPAWPGRGRRSWPWSRPASRSDYLRRPAGAGRVVAQAARGGRLPGRAGPAPGAGAAPPRRHRRAR